MPRIGDGYGQSANVGDVRRGEQRRTEQSRTDRSRTGGEASASSEDMRQMRTHQARLVEAAKNAPDVRADRVAQARARVQEGFYDRPEVRSAIAGRVFESFEGKTE